MKKQRIYIDTSVFGGYFDEEFEELTKPLFQRINQGEFTVIFSKITEEELEDAPTRVKKLVRNLKSEETQYVEVTEEAVDLAAEYINGNVVGKTSYADCLHISLATTNEADYLISWNFKHIVNVKRIRGYNAINIQNA